MTWLVVVTGMGGSAACEGGVLVWSEGNNEETNLFLIFKDDIL
jgi:hypothetical protein